MKKRYYNVGLLLYNRQLKCGDPIIGGALIGGGSVISGLFGASAQESANEANLAISKANLEQQEKLFHEGNQFNHDEAVLARAFNSQEAQIARDFNAQEAELNRTFQAGQLEKQMDWYEKYNSASAQVQRYLQAGLNPASLGGKTDYSGSFGTPSGAAATATPASGSAASAAAAPSLPLAHVEPVNPLGGVIKNALDGLGSYMNARKTGEETKGIITENQFKAAEKQLGLNLSQSEIEKNYSEVRYLSNEADLARQKIDESSAIIKNLTKQGEKLDTEIELKNIEKLYSSKLWEAKVGELQEKWHLAREVAECYTKMAMSEILKNQSEAAAAFSSAEYNKALASLVPAQRDRIMSEKNFIDSQNNHEKIRIYLDRKYGSKERALNLKVQKEQESKLEWENSGFVRGIGIVKDVAITAASVVGTVYGVGAIGNSVKAASAAAGSATSAARSANAAARAQYSARPHNLR